MIVAQVIVTTPLENPLSGPMITIIVDSLPLPPRVRHVRAMLNSRG
jgi:hypothetical protein